MLVEVVTKSSINVLFTKTENILMLMGVFGIEFSFIQEKSQTGEMKICKPSFVV